MVPFSMTFNDFNEWLSQFFFVYEAPGNLRIYAQQIKYSISAVLPAAIDRRHQKTTTKL